MKLSTTVAALVGAAVLPLTTLSPAVAAVSEPAPVTDPSGIELIAPVRADSTTAVTYRGKLYFTGTTPGTGAELWVTDGTIAGTSMVVDLEPGALSSVPRSLVVFKDRLYFTATVGSYGTEWWSTDGTAAGTSLYADIAAVPSASSYPAEPVVVGDHLFFSADNGIRGRELWSADGLPGGAQLAADIQFGAASGDPRGLTALGNKVIYAATLSNGSAKPWASVAGQFGSQRLDAYAIDANIRPENFIRVGDRVVFTADDEVNGVELWSTRGEPGDASIVADLYPGPTDSRPRHLTTLGDRVLFQARAAALGRELWTTDGTAGRTALVKDIYPGGESSGPAGLVPVGGQIFFSADGGALGRELWTTQGTTESTRMVVDAYPGPASSVEELRGTPSTLGRFFYLATDQLGAEPWVSDGTPSGTRRIADLSPGALSSFPDALGTVGLRTIFAAELGGTVGLYSWLEIDHGHAESPEGGVVDGVVDGEEAHGPVGSSTQLTAKRRYSAVKARKKQIFVTVRVADQTGEVVNGGQVHLLRKGKIIGTATLVDGKARVRIKARLRPGRVHRVLATWSGNDGAMGSTSATVRIRVKRTR